MVVNCNISGRFGHGALWRHLKPHTCSLPSACLGTSQSPVLPANCLVHLQGIVLSWRNMCACLMPNNAVRVCWLIGSSRLNWIQNVQQRGNGRSSCQRKNGQLWLCCFLGERLGFLWKFRGKRFKSSCVILQGSVSHDLLHSSCSFQQGTE